MTTDRMEVIGEKIFEPKLIELPNELQKPIILIISRSQQELRFNGGGMVYCTLESFGKVRGNRSSWYTPFFLKNYAFQARNQLIARIHLHLDTFGLKLRQKVEKLLKFSKQIWQMCRVLR